VQFGRSDVAVVGSRIFKRSTALLELVVAVCQLTPLEPVDGACHGGVSLKVLVEVQIEGVKLIDPMP